MKICIFSSEPIGDAFTRNYLVVSMHGHLVPKVKEIVDGLCLSTRRHI